MNKLLNIEDFTDGLQLTVSENSDINLTNFLNTFERYYCSLHFGDKFTSEIYNKLDDEHYSEVISNVKNILKYYIFFYYVREKSVSFVSNIPGDSISENPEKTDNFNNQLAQRYNLGVHLHNNFLKSFDFSFMENLPIMKKQKTIMTVLNF